MNSQAALSEGPISAPTGRRSGAPLIGNVGQEFVQSALSNDPIAGINEIQARASLADPRCRPLLGLLHQLGVNRTESHRYIVQQSIGVLLSRIPSLPGERLLSLLEETFPYITIPDLRAIPLAVLDRLRPVPSTFLKQLAADREIFWELPIGVQRQAWELDKKLLRTHALSLVSAYTYETATWVQALNMDEATELVPDDASKKRVGAGELNEDDEDYHEMVEVEGNATCIKTAAGSGGGGGLKAGMHHKLPQLARRNLRNGSAALRQLVAMVGSSPSVYRGIIDLCTVRFREQDSEKQTQSVGMKDAALCALRSQLLMAMHDAGETSITSGDSCHKLAWTLDACIKDKMFNSRRLLELRNFFSSFIKAADDLRQLGKKRRTSSSGRRGAQRSGAWSGDDDAESAGVPGAAAAFADDPLRELGAAGMILRDPAVFHLLLHQIVRCLEKCVEVQAVPKEDKDLVFLTQLLTLAVGVRSMLREGAYDFPDPDPEVLNTLYPLIADLILDAELMEVDDEDGQSGGKGDIEEEVEPPPEDMVFLMVKDEIGRRVVQTYALKRLAAGDLKTASRLLQAIERCIGYLAIPEFAPFAFTLARRVASLVASGKITTTSLIWHVAVDNVLIRLVDAETEAHEEVLRLLLAASKQLDAAKLGRYLASTLANSRPSRKEHKNRAADAAGLPPIGYFGPDSTWGDVRGGVGNSLYSPSSGDLLGDWQQAGGAHDARGPDGVRGTYALFPTKQPLLNKENAPELFEYLESTAPGDATVE